MKTVPKNIVADELIMKIFYVDIMNIIIHSKYFPDSDWLKGHA